MFQQFIGALLLQNKHLVGIGSKFEVVPSKYTVFEYIRIHGKIKKIKKAMKTPGRLSCFTWSWKQNTMFCIVKLGV